MTDNIVTTFTWSAGLICGWLIVSTKESTSESILTILLMTFTYWLAGVIWNKLSDKD